MIVVDSVTKYYGSNPAVRDLDFRIEKGECVGFLGLNGAGKTTTLRLLSCLLLPTSGRVSVQGLDAETQPHEIRKLIGFLPDRPPLYPEMTVREFLHFAGRLRRMDAAAVKKRLPEVLEIAGIQEVANEVIQTLSYGYQQRVGIAQAIVHNPALLILDEPIQGLDPMQIVEMREMIRGLRGSHTILLSTHILSEIQQTCDRILMLHQGAISAQGTEDELAAKFGGRTTIEVTVRSSRDALAAVLGKVDGVVDHSIHDEAAGSGVVTARLTAGKDIREQVARAIVGADLSLLALGRVSTGLESVFVQLSKESSS